MGNCAKMAVGCTFIQLPEAPVTIPESRELPICRTVPQSCLKETEFDFFKLKNKKNKKKINYHLG